MAYTEKYVSGCISDVVTPAGSHATIDSRMDEYGRCSSHQVTGYTPNGLSMWFARNVSHRDVLATVEQAEAAGWTHISAGVEGF